MKKTSEPEVRLPKKNRMRDVGLRYFIKNKKNKATKINYIKTNEFSKYKV